MNRTKLKNYAPQARRDFIQAMTDRAAYFGLTADKTEPVVQRGDVAVIAGREHPRGVAAKRKQLEDRIKRHGFESTMEAMAYTWFNRLVAIRFMELHGYLEHGFRVLSHPEGKLSPEILEHAEHVELPGLKKDSVIDLKLAGNKEGELYRLLLTAQCNALHTAMPFLFEKVEDETELLLPGSLLNSDSLIRKLVSEIEEDDWKEVEIIGWLYQFYISEKKDEVIGKVVASEDIPAATQLFTPNWIVKYLVQNTLGRQWLATYPQSPLRQEMAYYIEPAEQTPEVQDQLKAITPTSLNPEELTLLDPACGSGHILVEAYDLFKAIYQERGYRAKDIPALILSKNLFGLEIDDRAAQLAAFALMMKARADDRRIFDSEAKPNVVALQDSKGLSAADITHALNSPINKDDVPREYLFEEIQEEKDGLFSKKALAVNEHVSHGDIVGLLGLFEYAKTFGSLIQVPPKLAAKLPEIEKRLDDVLKFGDLTHSSAHVIRPLLQQAALLFRQYDTVVANPPYMGSNAMSLPLRKFAITHYGTAKADLYAMFVLRGLCHSKHGCFLGMVTMHSWMFLSTYLPFRECVLAGNGLTTLAHLGIGAFPELNSKIVQSVAFILHTSQMPDYRPVCFRLIDGDSDHKEASLRSRSNQYASGSQSDFAKIPGTPIAYWATESVRNVFAEMASIGDAIETREGMATAGNDRFIRFWCEVDYSRIGFGISTTEEALASRKRWFPYVKGGDFRKWFGNNTLVVDWENDGERVKANIDSNTGRVRSHNYNGSYGFRRGLTWTGMSNSNISMRLVENGYMFDAKGPMAFATTEDTLLLVQGVLNSAVGTSLMAILAPTLDFKLGHVMNVPFSPDLLQNSTVLSNVRECVTIAKDDWNWNEVSWTFKTHPFLDERCHASTIKATHDAWHKHCYAQLQRMAQLEEGNNVSLEQVYKLSDGRPFRADEITLRRPDSVEDIKSLLSFAVGCMMGRFSLDSPGLVYASSRNEGFKVGSYRRFAPNSDGIISVMSSDWFRDDAANRFQEFVGAVWPQISLHENCEYVANILGKKVGERSIDTIRRYFASEFYADHLTTYRAGSQAPKRPIYWLFSSGKQRAFQCLVYLHRYHEGTLARMRTEYVIPLQGQISARIEQLEGDKAKSTSTSHRKKLQKEQDDLKKQQAELLAFEEKLKHAADQKISLDLDDGVKVNYAKFGDLLAESKAITGGKDDE